MTDCNANSAKPDGLCIDAGESVNDRFSDKFGGLIIVQATGGIVASNLKERNLNIVYPDNKSTIVDMNSSFDRQEFYKWAAQMDATVFQTHLLYFKNQFLIYDNSSLTKAKRRFLVVGKDEEGVMHHYVVYLYSENTLKDATKKLLNLLRLEEILKILLLSLI